jgi:hypothetical protein
MRRLAGLIIALALASACSTSRRTEATQRRTEVTTAAVDSSRMTSEAESSALMTDRRQSESVKDSTVERWIEVWSADSLGNLVRQSCTYSRERYATAASSQTTAEQAAQETARRSDTLATLRSTDSLATEVGKTTTKTNKRPSWVQAVIIAITLAGAALIISKLWDRQ